MIYRITLSVMVGLLVLVFASGVWAHDSRPLQVEIAELSAGLYRIQARVPPTVPLGARPELRLVGDGCEPAVGTSSNSANVSALYECHGGLRDAALEIDYPIINPSLSTLLRVTWISGEERFLVAGPDEMRVALPTGETVSAVAAGYLALGIEHILLGPDHLLFVLCLLWLARTPKRVVLAITGFTIAHSLTLGLAALDLVRVPIGPMEASIALSVIVLAAELVRDRRDTLSWRYPVLASLIFGLLHGFGFADVLHEIGLPQTQLPAALLFFNLGVEIGQLTFAAIMVLTFLGIRRIARRFPLLTDFDLAGRSRGTMIAGYAIGGVAGFWFVERVQLIGVV